MLATIVYIVGLVLAIMAVIDIFKKPISLVGKIICAAIVLLTSWIGLAVYYLLLRGNLTRWFR